MLVPGVLVLLLVALDRAAVLLVEQTVAARAQAARGLARRPSVDIGGFPFLTQALHGRYDSVRVVGEDAPTGRLDVRLRGVQLPLADVLRRDVTQLPVDGLAGEVVLGLDDLARRTGRDVRLAVEGDRLAVTGSVEVLGRRLTATAVSEVRLEGDEVVVGAAQFRVGNAVADRVLSAALGDRLDLRLRVDLPYGLRLEGVQVRPDGVHLSGSAGPTVLRP